MLLAKVPVTTFEWLCVGVFAFVIGPLAIVGLRQMWRDDPRWAQPPSFWVSGRAQWFGLVRITPSAIIALTSAAALAPLFALLEEGTAAFGIVLFILLAGAFGGLLTSITTFLLNRPKFLVPPPRRGDPSALRELSRLFRRESRSGDVR